MAASFKRYTLMKSNGIDTDEERMAVLETNQDNQKEALTRVSMQMERINDVLRSVETTLSRNCAILAEVANDVHDLKSNQEKMNEALTKQQVENASIKTKVKTLWAVLISFITGVVGMFVKTKV
jgi:chromosome segregation ATPase